MSRALCFDSWARSIELRFAASMTCSAAFASLVSPLSACSRWYVSNCRTATYANTSVASVELASRSRTSRALSDRSGIVGDLIADAPHRHDGAIVPELASKLTDVDVHGPRVTYEGVSPDALQQLLACQHHAAMVEQLPQELELLRCQLDVLLSDGDLAAVGVDRDAAVLLAALRARRRGGRAAEMRADASHQLTRVERLGHVVVGADLETHDLVDVVVTGGEHQDRGVRRRAQR